MKRFSSEEVAKMAGVSRTTVSFVLNRTPGKRIPEETRKKVLQVAAELNYQPDTNAQKVAKSSRRNVGIVIYHSGSALSDAYVHRLLEGMRPVFNRRRCRPVLIPLRASTQGLEQVARDYDVDGLIVTNLRIQDWDINKEMVGGMPLVLIGDVPAPGAHQIDIDNRLSAHKVVEHLAELGHRTIGMIVHAPLLYNAAAERLEGYRQVLSERSLSQEIVEFADFTEESGYLAMKRMLAGSTRPTAVFASNDLVAYGAMQALHELRIVVPDDMSIVGFDDDYPSSFLHPPLTSLHVPAAAIGERAAEMVLDLMSGSPITPESTILPTSLTIRDSTARPLRE